MSVRLDKRVQGDILLVLTAVNKRELDVLCVRVDVLMVMIEGIRIISYVVVVLSYGF